MICQALVSIAASEGPPFADLCRGNAKLGEAHAWFGGPRIDEKQTVEAESGAGIYHDKSD